MISIGSASTHQTLILSAIHCKHNIGLSLSVRCESFFCQRLVSGRCEANRCTRPTLIEGPPSVRMCASVTRPIP